MPRKIFQFAKKKIFASLTVAVLMLLCSGTGRVQAKPVNGDGSPDDGWASFQCLFGIGDCGGSSQGSIWGTIRPPVDSILDDYGSVQNGGPVVFANRIIDILSVLAGAWLLFTIIWNGYTVIVSPKSSEAFAAAVKNILYSILGLMLVAFAYLISGYVSRLLFGSKDFIQQPLDQIQSAGKK